MILPWHDKLPKDMTVPRASHKDLETAALVVMSRTHVPDHIKAKYPHVPFVAAYYMLEGTKAKDSDVDTLEGYDAVFVPAEFCKKVLEESGLTTPVYVWGHGFDPEIFPYVEPKPNRPFTFLWFGDENRRKGYDLFLKAFSKLDVPNVRAWVRGPGSGNVANVRNQHKNDPRIVWDTKVTPAHQLKEMMAEVDMIVCPLRGEGFLLPMLEAMAAGRPAIATRFSGPLDFGGGDDLTYWISVKDWESAQNDAGLQAIPDMHQLVQVMQHCATHPDEVRERGVRASQIAHEYWRWDKKVLDVIPFLKESIPDFRIPIPADAALY
jgi:glycosyltransferase involved in cell wall biosynthesis